MARNVRNIRPCCSLGKARYVFSFAIISLVVIVLITTLGETAYAESTEDIIQRNIKHAKTYYWFGIAEKGNMQSFNRGSEYLDQAVRELNAAIKSASLPKKRLDDFRTQTKALRTDFVNQADVHHDTLYGVFPLVRLLAPSLFADALAVGTFELIDDPAVMASTAAGLNLCKDVLQKWSSKPQLDVVFNSVPVNKALENELLYIFNSSAKFFVHNYHEVAKALSSTQLAQFQVGNATPEIKQRLCEAFGISDLLVVTIREVDTVDSNYFYVTEGHLHTIYKDKPTHSFFNMGFSRDRRTQLWPIVLSNAILLVLSILIYIFLIYFRTSKWQSFPKLIVVPIIGFLLGRIMPWLLVPMLSSIAPAPETLAKVSFWWPCMTGAALFLAPVLLYRIVSARIRTIAPLFDIEGKGGAAFAAITMGVCAYLAGPLFLFLEGSAILHLLLLIFGSGIALYLIGRTFDQSGALSLRTALIPMIIILGLGAAFSHLKLGYLWVCACIVFFSIALVKTKKQEAIETEPEYVEGIPSDLSELARRADFPPYQKFEIYEQALQRVIPVVEGKTAWITLLGSVGTGKTATANAVVSELRKKLKPKGQEIALLKGNCPEMTSGAKGEVTPYAPFQKALSRHFEINVFAPPEKQLNHIDLALDGMFESAIPFAGMFFPSHGGILNPARNKDEIFMSVARMIRKLCEKKTVVLYIDDVHWIDEASMELLSFLLDNFSPGAQIPFIILLTSRYKDKIDDRMKRHTLKMEPPDREQRVEMLISSLGLKKEVAQMVVKKAGRGTAQKGELFWLFRFVVYLAEKGLLARTEEGFTWSEKYKGGEKLPIPGDFQESLQEQLNKVPEYRSVLECAACLGSEFNAGILADSLGVHRLELLQILDRIEDETGILIDVRESDDVYAFRSSFILEALRKKMQISEQGPRASEVKQLIREYHAKVAASLKNTLELSSNAIYDIAKHYYAAGASHAEEAVDYCLKAAHTARTEFLYAEARNYVDMAGECAEFTQRKVDMEKEYLIIDCDMAFVENSGRKKAADKGLAYLELHPEAPNRLFILIARACYDAGAAMGDQEYFTEAVRLAQLIVENKKTPPVEKAEGYHFIGISLPREEAKKREENLRTALNLIEAFPGDDFDAQSLLARVTNSLAEQLSYSATSNKKEVENLFNQSIEIKSRPEIFDRPGLARSHGGIGRLYLSQGDIDKARNNFKKDLDYSEQINDIGGQSMMHSSLGSCDLKENKFQDALYQFQDALKFAENPINKFYAFTGLLTSSCALKEKVVIEDAGSSLLALAKEKKFIPKDCAENIVETLKDCDHTTGPWIAELEELANKAIKQ